MGLLGKIDIQHSMENTGIVIEYSPDLSHFDNLYYTN